MGKMIIVVDLEATCWEHNNFKQQNEMEIIEIGGVLLDPNLDIIEKVSVFVKPILNPILTDFCKNLTSITQKDVDTAQEFPQALQDFAGAIKKHLAPSDTLDKHILASWGFYDKKQIIKDCHRHNISYPFGMHWNVKQAFSQKQGTKKRFGIVGALKKLSMEFEGNHHRGVDDAFNIARIIKNYFGGDCYLYS